jgi:hypothetical protein
MTTPTADILREAIARAPRATLPDITKALWAANLAGQITDTDAEALDEAIRARAAVAAIAPSSPRRVGSRPRTDASMMRRRRLAASGRMPPAIAAHYTLAEQAVLAVVATQVARHQRCYLAATMIAAIAGVSPSTVKAALRRARDLGHLLAQVRPRPGGRHDTTIRTIIAPEWVAWLRMPRRDDRYLGMTAEGGGGKSPDATDTVILDGVNMISRKGSTKRRKRAADLKVRPPLG